MPHGFFYILVSLVLISIVLAWLKSGSIINPVSFFMAWWGLFVFVSGLDLAGIRLPRNETYLLIFFSMALFSVGGITFLSSCANKTSGNTNNDRSGNYLLKDNKKIQLFLYSQLVITVILMIFADKGLDMLKSLDPGTYRYMVYTDYGIFQGHKVLVNYILRPAVFAGAFITMTGAVTGLIPKKYYGLAIFNMFIYSIVILGRSSIIMAIMCFFIALMYYMSVRKIRIRIRYVLILLIPVVFLISLSIFRKSQYVSGKSGTDIIVDYFIWYLTGPFTAFDYFLNTYREGADYDFTFFRMTLAGLEDVIEPAIRKIFPDFNQIFRKYTEILGTYRDFGGPATHHNSHYTMLFTFFADAGTAGIALYSYLFGALISVVFNSFRRKTDLFNLSALTLLTYLCMLGTTRWDFMFSWPWLTVAVVFFVSKRFVLENKYRGKIV
ncbi:MAG: O-antigen polymerase [Candidatus Delongbacteria bacterium]